MHYARLPQLRETDHENCYFEGSVFNCSKCLTFLNFVLRSFEILWCTYVVHCDLRNTGNVLQKEYVNHTLKFTLVVDCNTT